MNELTEGLRSTHLSDGSDALDRPEETDHLEQLPFYPPRSLGTTQKRLPRFLFRIATPESDGSTNKIWVKSQAAKDNRPSSTEDIFSNFTIKKRTNIAEILKVHLRWWPKYDLDDNFVSWTSSLLFAIQYIYYRHLSKKNRSSLANIKLYVIDTTKFPKGTFMRDLDLINIFCEYDQSEEYKSLRRVKTWRDGDLYFGEYLSQGALKIENKCQVIPADLIFQNNRLRRIQPNFAEPGEKEGDWAKEVIRLRKDIWSSSDLPVLSSADMIDRLKAIEEILENVEPIWRYPIAIYLAGLTGPMLWGKLDQETPDDSAFFSFFQSGLLQDDHFSGRDGFHPSTFNIGYNDIAAKLPEQAQVQKLTQVIYQHSMLRKALEHIQNTKYILREFHDQNIISNRGAFAAQYEPGGILSRNSWALVSKVTAVKKLCEQVEMSILRNGHRN